METETYETPVITVYGTVLALTKGPDGNERDGCSSGYYEADDSGDE